MLSYNKAIKEVEKIQKDNLKLVYTKDIPNGKIFHYIYGDYMFDLILENFAVVRLTWCFYDCLTEDEINFWRPRYNLKVFFAKDRYNNPLINDLIKSDGLKAIIFRNIETITQLQRDLHAVLIMLRGKK